MKERQSPVEFVLSHYRKNAFDPSRAYVKVRSRFAANGWRKYVGFAATAALLAMILVPGLKWLSSTTRYRTGVDILAVVLPDSSRVTLAPRSFIVYTEKKDKRVDYTLREVKLRGKAFFDVVPAPGKPFHVRTKDFLVSVTGTEFQVDAVRKEVYVESGRVSVFRAHSHAGHNLTDGMSARIDRSRNTPVVDEYATGNQVAWKRGFLVYENTALEVVLKELKEYLGLDISVDDGTDISKMRLTGEFDTDDPGGIVESIKSIFEIGIRVSN